MCTAVSKATPHLGRNRARTTLGRDHLRLCCAAQALEFGLIPARLHDHLFHQLERCLEVAFQRNGTDQERLTGRAELDACTQHPNCFFEFCRRAVGRALCR